MLPSYPKQAQKKSDGNPPPAASYNQTRKKNIRTSLSRQVLSSHRADSRYMEVVRKIAAVLISKKNRRIIIAGHERPDGDTAGASLALALALESLGKKTEVRSRWPLPEYLNFLQEEKIGDASPKVRIKIGVAPLQKKYDVAVILECSDLKRAGDVIKKSQVRTIINIDHHASYGNFGDINYVDKNSSAVSCQVFHIIKAMGLRITPKVAECLYTGILTDTGKFQQRNTTPEAFAIASELLKAGIDITRINENVYSGKSLAALMLLGRALSSVRVFDKKIAFITLSREDFSQTGAVESDTEEIINYPFMIKGVDISVMMRENPDGRIKVSMRSRIIDSGGGEDRRRRGGCDLLKIATAYGGGGHKYAAGFSVSKNAAAAVVVDMEKIRDDILSKIKSAL